MDGGRVLTLVQMNMRKLLREPATLFLLLIFPVVLVGVFGTVFGAAAGHAPDFRVGIIDLDADANSLWTGALSEALLSTEVVTLDTYVDLDTPMTLLEQGRLDALIVVPEGFAESCASYVGGVAARESTMDLYLDQGSLMVRQAFPPLLTEALRSMLGVGTVTDIPIGVSDGFLISTSDNHVFEIMAPGIFAYASIFITMVVAQSFVTDREKGLLRRLSVTPMRSSEFIFSQVLTYLLVAVIQSVILLVAVIALGLDLRTGIWGVALGMGIVTVFSLCNVGFGLITATISRSTGAATGLSFVFILPQMFLGTFMSESMAPSAQEASVFTPAYYVTDALTSLWVRGADLASDTVLLAMGVVSACSVIVVLVGVAIFHRFGKI